MANNKRIIGTAIIDDVSKQLALKLTSMNVLGFLNAAVDRPMFCGQLIKKLFSKNCETKKIYGLKLGIPPSCH